MIVVISAVLGCVIGSTMTMMICGHDRVLDDDDGWSCYGCKHIQKRVNETPCNKCRRDAPDYYEDREDRDGNTV